MQILGNTKSAFAEKLIEKSYKYFGEEKGYVMYVGQLFGLDASVVLVPSGNEDGIMAVGVDIDEINPVKLGQIYAELVQKYMLKYSDYKYTNSINPDGGMQIMFRKAMSDGRLETVTITTKIKRGKSGLSIFYGAGIEADSDTTNSSGIGINDL